MGKKYTLQQITWEKLTENSVDASLITAPEYDVKKSYKTNLDFINVTYKSINRFYLNIYKLKD